MFTYPDAACYHPSTNDPMLPTSKAHALVYYPFQRDGFMSCSTNNGDNPNYALFQGNQAQ